MSENKFQTMDEFLNDGVEPTEEDTTTVEEDGATGDESTQEDPTTTEQTQEDTTPADEKGQEDGKAKPVVKKPVVKKPENNPMKDLRDRVNASTRLQEKIDKTINRLSDGEYAFKLKDFKNDKGKVDYDDLIAAMDEADVKQRAETRGLSPEMQAEIEKYEREKKEVEIAKARVQMDRQLNNFQMEQQLAPDELNTFISDSMKMGINPLAIAALDKTTKGTVALKMLYKAVYTEQIVKAATDKAVADAKTKWEAGLNANGTQPKVNPAQPNSTKTTKTDPKGMALDDFLKAL